MPAASWASRWWIPSQITIDVAGVGEGSVIRLYDVAGRLVAFDEPGHGREIVRFHGMPPGVFFVEAVGRSVRAVAKVVVAP